MRHETFPVTRPIDAVVRIQSGSVEVEAGETQEAAVTVEALNGPAEKALGDVTIGFDGTRLVVEHGTGIRLGVIVRSPSFRVRLRIPSDSSLDVGTVSADVRGEGRLRSLDAKTVSGDLNVADVAEDATVKTVSGDVQLRNVAGKVVVNTVSGDVKVAEATRGVEAKTVSGDQSIDSITEGQVQLQSVSGDIRVGIQRGSAVWFDVRSTSGKTVNELDPTDGPPSEGPNIELRAKAVSSDIRIARAG
jgi:DUF4097 and DUF4098 domain-containing protein YvlB